MENKNKLKKEIIAYITEFFREFPEKEKVPNVWNTPIVGFADAMDPYIQNLPKLISPSHRASPAGHGGSENCSGLLCSIFERSISQWQRCNLLFRSLSGAGISEDRCFI